MQLRIIVNGYQRLVPEEGPEQWGDGDCRGFHNFCLAPAEDITIRVELVEPAEHIFEVILEKTEATKYGMQTSDGGDMIIIHSLRPGGLMARWNVENPNAQIRDGDCIIAANGVEANSIGIKNEMLMEGKLLLVIRRNGKRPKLTDIDIPPSPIAGIDKGRTSPLPLGNQPLSREVFSQAAFAQHEPRVHVPSNSQRKAHVPLAITDEGEPGPVSSALPRPALAKMSTAEFREVRDQAQAGVSGVRFLPTHIKNVQVLMSAGFNRWRAESFGQAHMTDGIAYRYSKNLKHIVEDSFLKWGETIKAYDEGDGWVKFSLTEEDFEIELDKKPGDVLGVDTMRSSGGEIYVERVNQTGLVADWNNSNPSYKVHPGDCIVEVNGVKGHSGRMMNKLKSRQVLLKVTVRRPVGLYQAQAQTEDPDFACEVDNWKPPSNVAAGKTQKKR
jgi:hypothetical protein